MYAAKPVNIKKTAKDENKGQGLGVSKKKPVCLTLNKFFERPRKRIDSSITI